MYNNQLLLSAKFGDACYVNMGKNYKVMFQNKNLDYLSYKKNELNKLGIYTRDFQTVKSGYKKGSFSYSLDTRVNSILTEYAEIPNIQAIRAFNKEGLILFYLDDGTYHQNKHFMHLYCNTFSDIEVDELIKVFFKHYPQKLCAKRVDRKKDGRSYPYIYIPVVVAEVFKKDVHKFLIKNDIPSLLYKTGLPSQTIESRISNKSLITKE